MKRLLYLVCLLFSLQVVASDKAALVDWQDWSKGVFEQAQLENKLVLLDLEAVWCHWCHVMDEKTYHDPKVAAVIKKHFVAVRVDQDAHPELSNRFEDWGWPATVIFAADGTELIKRRGYIRPELMYWLLQGVYDNPAPDPDQRQVQIKAADGTGLSDAQRADILDRYEWIYDPEYGGWGNVHKFIHGPSLEYAMHHAHGADRLREFMARQTLRAALQLIDPHWGGIYQYSDSLDWRSPHFEKIMLNQTDTIKVYALAYAKYDNEDYLHVAQSVYRYLTGFLLDPGGAFYTSQDADLNATVDGHAFYKLSDSERRKLGMPRIDKNIYARENGWVISALAYLYAATGEHKYLATATRAVDWIMKHRALPDGGFRHGETEATFLGDNLAMGRAFVDLFAVTGERRWLDLARRATAYIAAYFKHPEAGFVTVPSGAGDGLLKPTRHLESNVDTVRLANLLHRYTADDAFSSLAHHGMRYLTSTDLTDQRRLLAGVLLADLELHSEPVHITVVGHKDDPQAQQLFAAALGYPAVYKRTDWWDKREGPLPNPDIRYPSLDKPAAFACANQTCSLPVFEPTKIAAAVDRLYR